MSPRYVAARRTPGRRSQHLTARQLGRMRRRFVHLVLGIAAALVLAACVLPGP